jgi:hypothetical protein
MSYLWKFTAKCSKITGCTDEPRLHVTSLLLLWHRIKSPSIEKNSGAKLKGQCYETFLSSPIHAVGPLGHGFEFAKSPGFSAHSMMCSLSPGVVHSWDWIPWCGLPPKIRSSRGLWKFEHVKILPSVAPSSKNWIPGCARLPWIGLLDMPPPPSVHVHFERLKIKGSKKC